ncbi:MAG: MerR family transcriptional regulator [Akkermansiaceae bacterium]|nr:MerR family transcriptional regulator [Akkermansiaceae bacterium]
MTEKARYTISALSRKTGLSVHTLRFYEKEGIIRHVERTESGRRVYGEDSIGCLIGALCLKQARLTLAQIKEFFDLTVRGSESLPHRLEMLTTARENLEFLKNNINKSIKLVDFFIDGTKSAMEAMKNGDNPDEAFPLLTREGIATIPTMVTEEGKLEPYMPAIIDDMDD